MGIINTIEYFKTPDVFENEIDNSCLYCPKGCGEYIFKKEINKHKCDNISKSTLDDVFDLREKEE